ncbi:MAG TPA: ribonuclease R, partial [Alphaproteobacteria bacterium]|nr:ribonuclease R [Alphaproteobacteria bacterium]
DAHRLIEEFMIQANVAAAETVEARKGRLIYRVHDQPNTEKLQALSDFLRTLNIKLAPHGAVRTPQLSRILSLAADDPNKELISEIMLRSQSLAVYDPENIGHFGLNLRRYAHFTSPIRRYADLIVHRALIRFCGLGEDGLSDTQINALKDIADTISACERRSMAAEREANERYLAAYMADQVGATFAAKISGVTRFGLFVRLDETGADGLVPMRALGQERFNHDTKAHALIGARSGRSYRLGQRVTVTLVEATPITGGLRFELADEATPQRPSSPRKGFRTPAKRRR